MSEQLEADCVRLREFLYANVYFHPRTHAEFHKASKVLGELHAHYLANPDQLGPGAGGEEPARLVCDFVAGMTDRFAVLTFERLFVPQPWQVL